jgi:hypothetical protein
MRPATVFLDSKMHGRLKIPGTRGNKKKEERTYFKNTHQQILIRKKVKVGNGQSTVYSYACGLDFV